MRDIERQDRMIRQNSKGIKIMSCLQCGEKTIFGALCDDCRQDNHETCKEMTLDQIEAAKCTCFLSMCACPIHDPGRAR